MRNRIIENVEEEFVKKDMPAFRAGDTVVVNFKIKEGDKERIQPFEGLVIKKHNNGISSTFTVRKTSSGIGVERTFPLYSTRIESINIKKLGRVRRAKLYYLRQLSGKSAKIKERRKGF